jgi:hypothetical protein
MYISSIPNRKSPPAVLLRKSFRENGKVKNRTLAALFRLCHGCHGKAFREFEYSCDYGRVCRWMIMAEDYPIQKKLADLKKTLQSDPPMWNWQIVIGSNSVPLGEMT